MNKLYFVPFLQLKEIERKILTARSTNSSVQNQVNINYRQYSENICLVWFSCIGRQSTEF